MCEKYEWNNNEEYEWNNARMTFRKLRDMGYDAHIFVGSFEKEMIEVTINNKLFIISPNTRKFCRKGYGEFRKWSVYDDIKDIIECAERNKESPPTQKQIDFIDLLADDLNIKYDHPKTIDEAAKLINKMKRATKKGE